MPLYDVICDKHGTQEVFSHEPHYNCPICSKPAHRKWSNPAVYRMDFRAGWDMGAGKMFVTKRERENWISESGSRRVRD